MLHRFIYLLYDLLSKLILDSINDSSANVGNFSRHKIGGAGGLGESLTASEEALELFTIPYDQRQMHFVRRVPFKCVLFLESMIHFTWYNIDCYQLTLTLYP